MALHRLSSRPTTSLNRRRPAVTGHPWIIVLGCLLSALWAAPSVQAQDSTLVLYVRRNVGYSGGSQIEGSFRMEVTGPPDLTSVTFKIDQVVVDTDSEPPFRVNFDTKNYADGWHDLVAEGRTADGRTLTSNTRRFEFVPAGVGFQVAGQIAVLAFGGIAAVFILVTALQVFLTRRSGAGRMPLGAPRNYGWLGGAICTRCGRPFPRHVWALNISFTGKLDRCDHCGKWSVVRRATPEQLAAAEAAERRQAAAEAAPATPIAEPSPEERLRKQLDDSQYTE